MPPKQKPDRAASSYQSSLRRTLRWDAARAEAYLQLPSFPSVRITPFRPGIAADLVQLFNEPQIGRRLYRLPYPMGEEFAEGWVRDELAKAEAAGAELVESLERPPPDPTDLEAGRGPEGAEGGQGAGGAGHDCRTDHHARSIHLSRAAGARALPALPFKSIRLDGRIVGDIGLTPGEPDEIAPAVPDAPREQQTWHLGYVLSRGAEGAGIMSESVGVVLAFAGEWMGVRRIEAIVENDNPGSVAVLERNGFRRAGDTVTAWPEEKGGGQRFGGRYLWTRPEEGT